MPNEIERLQHGFLDLMDHPDVAQVARLRNDYANVVAYFGGKDKLPSTVIRIKRDKLDKQADAHASDKSCVKVAKYLNDKSLSKVMRKAKYISHTGSQNGALSRFPQDFARTIVLFYTNPGDTIVDPFAGHNSRMEATARAGRNYIGQDLHHGFMEFNRQRADVLRQECGVSIELHEGDSRRLPIGTGVGDFGFTCPPYWRIERYDKNDPAQLENAENGYEGFLVGLGEVMKEHYRTLKPGAFCVWVVNFFRWQGKFIRFHDDTKRLALEAGFEMWDEFIMDHGRAMRDAFMSSCLRIKKLPKRHEVGLVFRKPYRKGRK